MVSAGWVRYIVLTMISSLVLTVIFALKAPTYAAEDLITIAVTQKTDRCNLTSNGLEFENLKRKFSISLKNLSIFKGEVAYNENLHKNRRQR